MIRIAITQAAFNAIAATLQLGSVSYENHVNERGERYVWLPPNVVDRLKAQRRTRRELQRCDPAVGERVVERLAAVVDAERPRLLALGKLKQEIGQSSPCFATSLRDESPLRNLASAGRTSFQAGACLTCSPYCRT